MKNNAVEPIKLITCIVNRGDGETVTELCAREGISCSVVLRGRGTADNAMLTMLGLGESEKDIVMLTVGQSRQGEIMEKLTVTLHLNERGKGIAFSISFFRACFTARFLCSAGRNEGECELD